MEKKKKKELLLGKSVIFSSKEVLLAKHEHKLAFISWCPVTVNITNKPSQGREPNPALPAPSEVQLKRSSNVFVT